MARAKPFNLFVYGTLMSPSVFRAVLGRRMVHTAADADGVETFLARDAVLGGHRKISPDGTYLYAVPDPQGRIRGYAIGPLPGECMTALRKYEGRNYVRKTLTVQTREGQVQAYAFLANLAQLEHSFGYQFHDPLKQEILLRKKIEAALLEAEREQLHTDERIARRAIGELHGSTIRDLVRRHFEAGGISDYAIRHSLKDTPLRNFTRIATDKEAKTLAPHYLAMVVRQVIFNELEERIRTDFRYELDHLGLGDRYYERTISSLAALQILNEQAALLNLLVGDCLADLHFPHQRLVDFVQWAIEAGDGVYDPRVVKHQIEFIRDHMNRGRIPLGAELEFSNIGHYVIVDPAGRHIRDAQYDGFLYFADFGLDMLTWKLGGHVDDHHEKASARPRRGFFELALGSLSIEANISKPITDDPWVLGRIIHQTRAFYDIVPHSLHVSMQLRSSTHKPLQSRLLPVGDMKCLFALAGDLWRTGDGGAKISRLTSEEIVQTAPAPHMLFSQISVRRSTDVDVVPDSYSARGAPLTASHYVQQFKFLRLSPKLDYEPIILAMKGLQISLRPGTFLTAAQYKSSAKHREAFEELLAWGAKPQPIPGRDIEDFLGHVHAGLATEYRRKPAHNPSYIAWGLNRLREMLNEFNAQLVRSPQRQ
jgi:hypothetical protein